MKLEHAELSFNPKGTPQSDAFDDIYYSNNSGILESEYVFLEGNRLLETWQTWPNAWFCIGETGFGTGLNFLLTVRAFAFFRRKYPKAPLTHLYFTSFEKFPIEISQLRQILGSWPELRPFADALINRYPLALSGLHRCSFDAFNVTLDLILGDARPGMEQMFAGTSGRVNAWYLDGFAPSKNDSMWTESLFQQIGRLSAKNASLATFSAAGQVKRSLKKYGFEVKKVKGFGRKREMLVAQFTSSQTQTGSDTTSADDLPKSRFTQSQAPYFYRRSIQLRQTEPLADTLSIAIVGAGIAGALLAFRLTQLGHRVTLICKDKTAAQGASGNPIGGFYPQVNAEAGLSSQFFVHSFLYARSFYQDIYEQGVDFEHEWCGVLQLGFNQNTRERLTKMASSALWPNALAQVIDATASSGIAGVELEHPSLHIPQGGWISPLSLVNECLKKAEETGKLSTLFEHELLEFDRGDRHNGVNLHLKSLYNDGAGSQNTELRFDACIIATGHKTGELISHALPTRLTRGQVEHVPDTAQSAPLKTVLCHKGYFTPSVNSVHALGSTYVKNDLNTDYRDSERQLNLNMHQKALAGSDWLQALTNEQVNEMSGRAAIRCSTPDHLPLMGAMPNIAKQTQELAGLYKALPAHRYPIPSDHENVFILSGLGSRGLTSAPLLVDALVAQILKHPIPMQNNLLNAVNPNRFLVRALIRRQTYP